MASARSDLADARAHAKQYEEDRDQLSHDLWVSRREVASLKTALRSLEVEHQYAKSRWNIWQTSGADQHKAAEREPLHSTGTTTRASSASLQTPLHALDLHMLPPTFRGYYTSREQLVESTVQMARNVLPRRGAASDAVARIHEEAARTRRAELQANSSRRGMEEQATELQAVSAEVVRLRASFELHKEAQEQRDREDMVRGAMATRLLKQRARRLRSEHAVLRHAAVDMMAGFSSWMQEQVGMMGAQVAVPTTAGQVKVPLTMPLTPGVGLKAVDVSGVSCDVRASPLLLCTYVHAHWGPSDGVRWMDGWIHSLRSPSVA
jgi:hypothetical protein